jgi:hypothetical protein
MSRACPIINVGGRKVAVEIPHFIFVTALAGWAAWFCWDAWHAGPSIENLILIVPVSALAVILYFFVAASCFLRISESEEQLVPREPMARGMAVKIAGSMALLGAFVVAGPMIGFDIASFAYMLGMMFFLGERRVLVLLIVPLVFCVAVIYCFNTLLSTPLPLFFGERA